MNTYSHALVAVVLEKAASTRFAEKLKALPPMRLGAIVVGSLIPDLMLTLIAVVTIARDLITGALADIDPSAFENMSAAEMVDAPWTVKLFQIWFFENPWVIAAQQVFHSPLMLILFIGLTYWIWKRRGETRDNTRAGWFFWMCCASMLHSMIDIPLHVHDGPLLLFPLNWNLRYISPVSYWDSNYYGTQWTYFEHALDLVLIGYLVWAYRQKLFDWMQRG